MKFLGLGRGKGKTEAMLDWLTGSKKRRLVVINVKEKDRLLLELTEYFEKRIITASDLGRGVMRGTSMTEYGFDNVDMILEVLCGGRVDLVTYTPELAEEVKEDLTYDGPTETTIYMNSRGADFKIPTFESDGPEDLSSPMKKEEDK